MNKETDKEDKLLTESECAARLSCSRAWLSRDRHIRLKNPKVPYVKISGIVRYLLSDVEAVIRNSRIGNLPNVEEDQNGDE